MKKCPFCLNDIPEEARICKFCHQTLTKFCPLCAEEISAIAKTCRFCGADLEAIPERTEGTETTQPHSVPWEDPSLNIFVRFWKTWAQSMFHPDSFFQRLPTDTGHGKPIGYMVFLMLQLLLMGGVCCFLPYAFLVGRTLPEAIRHHDPHIGAGVLGLVLLGIPLAFLLTIGVQYLLTAIYHLLAIMLGGRAPFQHTLRVLCYSHGTQIWGLIPYVGAVIQPIWQAILYYYGFRRIHGLSQGSALALSLLHILCCFMCLCGTFGLYVTVLARIG